LVKLDKLINGIGIIDIKNGDTQYASPLIIDSAMD